MQDIGAGRGKYYAVNFPMRDGIDDECYQNTFVPIMSKVMECYQPSAVVLQCGADSLSGDRLGLLFIYNSWKLQNMAAMNLVMGLGTQKPETRGKNPTWTRKLIPEQNPKPDIQNPKTQGYFGFHKFPPNLLTFTPELKCQKTRAVDFSFTK